MSDHVYKQIRLTGSSTNSIEDAVGNAVRRASRTVEHMRWFQVLDTRGHIENGRISHWQVSIEVGFTIAE